MKVDSRHYGNAEVALFCRTCYLSVLSTNLMLYIIVLNVRQISITTNVFELTIDNFS